MKEIIRLDNIKRDFHVGDETVHALRGVSFSIHEGEFVTIMGTSGSGKSTLLNTLGCLDTPTSGEYYLDGVSVRTMNKRQRATLRNRKIGFVFQSYNLLAKTTAGENVELPLMYNPAYKAAQRREKAVNALIAVGLGDRLMHKSNQMSGGQMQRVAIARALANDPKVLLCDEATSALDPQTTHSILQLLKEVNERLGLTIVIITHQMEVIKEICDRVAVMQNGAVVEQGNIVDVFSDPQAPITKDFIEAADNFEAFSALIKMNGAITGISHEQPIWFLTYRGVVAGEPLMSELYRLFKVKANIIYGNIDYFKECIVGKLGVAIEGEDAQIKAAKAFLIEKQVRVEVLR